MFALVGVVLLMDRSQWRRTSSFGLVGFSRCCGGLLIALFSTMLGRDRGAAVMGAEPSDSRTVVAGMFVSFCFPVCGYGLSSDGSPDTNRQLMAQNEEFQVEQLLDIPNEQPTPEPGTAGLNKGSGGGSKPKPEHCCRWWWWWT